MARVAGAGQMIGIRVGFADGAACGIPSAAAILLLGAYAVAFDANDTAVRRFSDCTTADACDDEAIGPLEPPFSGCDTAETLIAELAATADGAVVDGCASIVDDEDAGRDRNGDDCIGAENEGGSAGIITLGGGGGARRAVAACDSFTSTATAAAPMA